MRHFLRFLKSKVFFLNIAIAIVLGFGILIGFYQWLKVYTHHNESLSVPDLSGMKMKEVKKVLDKRDLNYVIDDSTYVPDKPKLAVVEQQPEALSKVKINRKIYLTLNSPNPPKEPVPNLKDVSLRQSLKILKKKGFKVGELKYIPGLAKNTVQRLEVNGRTIGDEDKLEKGTEIDLVLEEGKNSGKTEIPNLKGLTLDDAEFYLKGKGLNFGAVIYEDRIEDSAMAIIYKQKPFFKEDEKIPKGEVMDVWLTTPEQFEKMNMPDSAIKDKQSVPDSWE